MLRIIMAAAAVLTASAASAQDRIGVLINFNGDDAAGKRLAYFLRDEVRKSGTFREVTKSEDSAFTLDFITIDPATSGSLTSYSYAIQFTNDDGFNYFIASYAGYCGSDRLKDCAELLVGNLGEKLESIKAALKANKGFND